MTKHTREYSNEQFSTSFFEYDVSKLRTDTAVPFDDQGLWWHFAKYEQQEFSCVDSLDTIYRHVSEIDSDLAEEFAANAKEELDDFFHEVNVRLEELIDRYSYQYASDEEYVKERLLALKVLSTRRAKAAA